MQEGPVWTFAPNQAFTNFHTMLGYAHFGPFEGHADGQDLLPLMHQMGTAGFTTPLTEPSYTFWLQQTGTEVTYQLDFVVSALPEPASLGMFGAAGITLVAVARRVRRRISADCSCWPGRCGARSIMFLTAFLSASMRLCERFLPKVATAEKSRAFSPIFLLQLDRAIPDNKRLNITLIPA
jgi:hypothetical protein